MWGTASKELTSFEAAGTGDGGEKVSEMGPSEMASEALLGGKALGMEMVLGMGLEVLGMEKGVEMVLGMGLEVLGMETVLGLRLEVLGMMVSGVIELAPVMVEVLMLLAWMSVEVMSLMVELWGLEPVVLVWVGVSAVVVAMTVVTPDF